MAEIVLGVWTTHGPTLNTTPEQWLQRVKADQNRKHWHKGAQFSFDELVAKFVDRPLADIITLEERTRRHARCQTGIAEVARRWRDAAPTHAVIFGNDQRELVQEQLQPQITVYYGDTFWHEPLPEAYAKNLPPGIHDSEWGYRPKARTTYEAIPDLAEMLFKAAETRGVDLAASNKWPEFDDTHWHTGTPHAFGFILMRIMQDKVIPTLPIMLNTFFPPNQATAKRCFEYGRFVADVIEQWDADARVAVVGSGGMSHFVIDEELDERVLSALADRDAAAIQSIEQNLLTSGSSELRQWIAAAGALFPTDLKGGVIDYVPCYRSEAGTGTANGFVVWS